MSTRSIFHSSPRSIAQLAAISLFAFASHPAPAIAIDDPLELADEAVRENPGIEALQARTQALAAITRSVGTWQDPLLGIEYLNAPVDSFRLDRSPMSGLQFSLQQTLPEWGWSRASRPFFPARGRNRRPGRCDRMASHAGAVRCR